MSMRRKGRELALQALYQIEITQETSDKGLDSFGESFEHSPRVKEFAWTLVRGVLERREEIDHVIAAVSERWRTDRLSRVDLNVIRIAIYEMTTPPELPLEIAIDEAVEIARRFGAGDSPTFVNGILDQVASRLGRKPARQPQKESGGRSDD